MIDMSNLPPTVEAAFARLGEARGPGIDDLKTLVLIEAWGQGYYGGLADSAPNEPMRMLFEQNAQEELDHAHRVSKAIEKEYGESFPVPSPEQNPYYARPQNVSITRKLLEGIARGEFGGENFYEKFAVGMKNSEAAALMRQNGKEELRHGKRLEEALTFLPS